MQLGSHVFSRKTVFNPFVFKCQQFWICQLTQEKIGDEQLIMEKKFPDNEINVGKKSSTTIFILLY